jgi:hypothetical protein
MNKLVIIGNGFDLAHGLKTRYSDFVLWYLNNCYSNKCYLNQVKSNIDEQLIKKNLVTIFEHNYYSGDNYSAPNAGFKSIEEFKKMKSPQYTVEYYHPFFKYLIQTLEFNWVDIELEYYKFLKEIYKDVEKSNTGEVSNSIKEEVKKLNQCLDLIKEKLEEYLSTIKTEKREVDLPQEIKVVFNNYLINNHMKNEGENIYFLNFNYTNTIFNYTNLFKLKKSEVNYIHGKLNEKINPIIFGYGDETDKNYEKIEDLNENEFTRHFKSFSYLTTSNYQNLFEYLGNEEFEVHIMGHSCGLSDRVLFNHIFEHDNFKKVQLYYYQYGEKNYENDFFQKTQELSRHFKLNSKHRMRTRIVPFNKSSSLTKFNPQN